MKKRFKLEAIPFHEELTIEEDFSIRVKPSGLVEKLDKYVIGQLEAKKALSVAAVNHMAFNAYNSEHKDRKPIKTSNLMIVGPSGSGKTLLVESLARELGCEYISVDITQFSPSGYVGANVSEILDRYISSAKDESKLASGIIFVDEIDKISNFNTEDDSFKSTQIQSELLKLIEGGEVSVEPASSSRPAYSFRSDGLLWIFGGSFAKYREHLDKENSVKRVGYTDTRKKKPTNFSHDMLMEVGFLPEFAGRVGTIVELERLTIEDFKRILTEPINCPAERFRILGEYRNLSLALTKKDVDFIAKKAYDMNIGARALQIVAEEFIKDKLYN
jgi:ATP-dependent Clp protease ATP-binding subunit ClpX